MRTRAMRRHRRRGRGHSIEEKHLSCCRLCLQFHVRDFWSYVGYNSLGPDNFYMLRHLVKVWAGPRSSMHVPINEPCVLPNLICFLNHVWNHTDYMPVHAADVSKLQKYPEHNKVLLGFFTEILKTNHDQIPSYYSHYPHYSTNHATETCAWTWYLYTALNLDATPHKLYAKSFCKRPLCNQPPFQPRSLQDITLRQLVEPMFRYAWTVTMEHVRLPRLPRYNVKMTSNKEMFFSIF